MESLLRCDIDSHAIWGDRTRGKAATGTGAACHVGYVHHMAPSQVLHGAFGLEQAGKCWESKTDLYFCD